MDKEMDILRIKKSDIVDVIVDTTVILALIISFSLSTLDCSCRWTSTSTSGSATPAIPSMTYIEEESSLTAIQSCGDIPFVPMRAIYVVKQRSSIVYAGSQCLAADVPSKVNATCP
jgi:hypothetical protein